jgi:NADH-quinone oxidoreductase subunit A
VHPGGAGPARILPITDHASQSGRMVQQTGLLMELEVYLPVLLFIVMGCVVGFALLFLGSTIGPNRPDAEKLSPYECGFEAFEDARMKFDVRYYLVAILFILFDLEIAFLFPWAMANNQVGLLGFGTVLVFLAILVVGFIYEWKKGALDWE